MLIFDLVDPQELVGVVREAERDINEEDLILSQVLPNVTQDSITFKYTVGQVLGQNAAKFRSWDTPAPIGKRQGLETRHGELAPISEKIPVTEEMAHRLRDLQRGGGNDSLIDQIFDDAANEARAVARRIELARGEVLETAGLTINENGVIQVVDFGRHVDLEPAALAGTAQFSDLDDSDPVAVIRADMEIYREFNNGRDPGAIITSGAVISNLLLNDSLRALLGTVTGAPGVISEEALTRILQAYGIPPLVAYDIALDIDDVPTRVISDDVLIYVPAPARPAGQTAFGPTMEAIKLAEAQQISIEDAPGLVAVVEETSDPVQTWTKAAGVALPILSNPNSTLVHHVQ